MQRLRPDASHKPHMQHLRPGVSHTPRKLRPRPAASHILHKQHPHPGVSRWQLLRDQKNLEMPGQVHWSKLLTGHRCERSSHNSTAKDRNEGNHYPKLHGIVDEGVVMALFINFVVLKVSIAVRGCGKKRPYMPLLYNEHDKE